MRRKQPLDVARAVRELKRFLKGRPRESLRGLTAWATCRDVCNTCPKTFGLTCEDFCMPVFDVDGHGYCPCSERPVAEVRAFIGRALKWYEEDYEKKGGG